MSDVKITIKADTETWKRFRIACLEAGVAAGRALEILMKWQLEQWAKEKQAK